jgi:hypothetical protein
MKRPRVIVCEQTGKWAAAIARHLPSAIRLRQTRGLRECAGELALAPCSLLALELTLENLAGVLALLGDLDQKFPLARAIVVAERRLAAYKWLLREAGAVHFTTSPRESRCLAGMASRHVDRTAVPMTDLATEIWDELPWNEVA